jgi:Hemolysin coregulated protein Hcp (TssD)
LPCALPLGGYFEIVIETTKDNTILDWMLQTDGLKDAKIIIPSRFGTSASRIIELKEVYCVEYANSFKSTSTEPMTTRFKLSPGGTYENGTLVFIKHWHKEKPVVKLEPYEKEDKEKKNIEIVDIYLDKSDATVLFNFGKVTGDIRIIDKYDWEDANAISDDTEKINKLKSDSRVVLVNDIQIQQKIQEIHSLTNKVEEQIFVVLNRDNANVEAVIGPKGTDGHTEIDADYKGIGQDDKGKTIYSKSPTIKTDGKRYPLLGQVHTHNLMNSEPKNLNQIGTEETKENDFGTSSIDQSTAKSLGIEIYSLDSWNFYSKTAEVTLNRVDPTGKETKGIGKSIGKGQGKKIVNVGLECLNLRVGRK